MCVCLCKRVPFDQVDFSQFPAKQKLYAASTDGNVIWLLAIIFGADHKPKARCSQSRNGVKHDDDDDEEEEGVSQSPVSRGVGDFPIIIEATKLKHTAAHNAVSVDC